MLEHDIGGAVIYMGIALNQVGYRRLKMRFFSGK